LKSIFEFVKELSDRSTVMTTNLQMVCEQNLGFLYQVSYSWWISQSALLLWGSFYWLL